MPCVTSSASHINILTTHRRKMESRDHRRWTMADEDTDGKLNKLEFRNFLHPEEADHMKDIVVQVLILRASLRKAPAVLSNTKQIRIRLQESNTGAQYEHGKLRP
jgi:hypothetical protein